jgi:hypothetical protein
MKICYINKERMPKLQRRDLRGIVDPLVKDPTKTAKIAVKNFEEAKALSYALHSSSGVRKSLPEGYRLKTQSTDKVLWVTIEKRKNGRRG